MKNSLQNAAIHHKRKELISILIYMYRDFSYFVFRLGESRHSGGSLSIRGIGSNVGR